MVVLLQACDLVSQSYSVRSCVRDTLLTCNGARYNSRGTIGIGLVFEVYIGRRAALKIFTLYLLYKKKFDIFIAICPVRWWVLAICRLISCLSIWEGLSRFIHFFPVLQYT